MRRGADLSAPWEHVDAGDGVLLRRPVAEDAAGVLAVHGDSRVYEHDPHLTQSDLAAIRAFLVETLEHWDRGGSAPGRCSCRRPGGRTAYPARCRRTTTGCTPVSAAPGTT